MCLGLCGLYVLYRRRTRNAMQKVAVLKQIKALHPEEFPPDGTATSTEDLPLQHIYSQPVWYASSVDTSANDSNSACYSLPTPSRTSSADSADSCAVSSLHSGDMNGGQETKHADVASAAVVASVADVASFVSVNTSSIHVSSLHSSERKSFGDKDRLSVTYSTISGPSASISSSISTNFSVSTLASAVAGMSVGMSVSVSMSSPHSSEQSAIQNGECAPLSDYSVSAESVKSVGAHSDAWEMTFSHVDSESSDESENESDLGVSDSSGSSSGSSDSYD